MIHTSFSHFSPTLFSSTDGEPASDSLLLQFLRKSGQFRTIRIFNPPSQQLRQRRTSTARGHCKSHIPAPHHRRYNESAQRRPVHNIGPDFFAPAQSPDLAVQFLVVCRAKNQFFACQVTDPELAAPDRNLVFPCQRCQFRAHYRRRHIQPRSALNHGPRFSQSDFAAAHHQRFSAVQVEERGIKSPRRYDVFSPSASSSNSA